MPGIQSRSQQVVSEELSEYPMTGPFGGIQSEMPPTEIEPYGFQDSKNILFRKSAAYVRPGYTALTSIGAPVEPILNIGYFHNNLGEPIQFVLTPTRLLKWDGSSSTWTEITGPGFTGTATQPFSTANLGYKLCFSQGYDQVFTWDGISATYVLSSASSVACKAMSEVALHLVVGNTVEGGVAYPQRYRWTGAGDPTDWTSFNSGINDEVGDLGRIYGIIKLGMYGYGMHHEGIIQIIPTGVGTAPFYFIPVVNCSIGNISAQSLDHFNRDGVEQAVFASWDNVYIFNQSSLIPIGDMPLAGTPKRIGARSRILGDIYAAGPDNCYGFVSIAINGQVFNAYWLVCPNVGIWVYNFDESNWTVFTYDKTVSSVGVFILGGVPRIKDLVGTILQQNWTPATAVALNAAHGIAIGFTDGTVGYVDFTNFSETPWRIISAKHTFGDRRHLHSVKKFRLAVLDLGSVTYNVTVTNERGYSETQSVTIGTGSGDVLSTVLGFNVTGLRIEWQVSGAAGAPGAMVEFCPLFSIGGEQRGYVADGN